MKWSGCRDGSWLFASNPGDPSFEYPWGNGHDHGRDVRLSQQVHGGFEDFEKFRCKVGHVWVFRSSGFDTCQSAVAAFDWLNGARH